MGRHPDPRDDTLPHRHEPTERHLVARPTVQADDGEHQPEIWQAHHHIAQEHRRTAGTNLRQAPAVACGGGGKDVRRQDWGEGVAKGGAAHCEILQPGGRQQQGG